MKLLLESDDIDIYLMASWIIDYHHPEIILQAERLREGSKTSIELVKHVYEYVRDHIHHSADIGGKVVTFKASDVLKHKQGICYAKAHLLAALLRYLKIPTGLCYQRILLDDESKPWLILHGLVSVFIEEEGRWIRLDPRGNKPGVDAQFDLNQEKLAFPIREELGEEDLPYLHTEPDANVMAALLKYKSIETLFNHLPTELCPYRICELEKKDHEFLEEMLYQAIHVREGESPPPRDIIYLPEMNKYICDWGKPTDVGFMAVDKTTQSKMGIGWLRLLTHENKGYGYVSDETPELSIAVAPEFRGFGIGTKLMLYAMGLTSNRFNTISLSVDPDNEAIELYKRLGFIECGVSGTSIVMLWKRKEEDML